MVTTTITRLITETTISIDDVRTSKSLAVVSIAQSPYGVQGFIILRGIRITLFKQV